MDNKYEFTSEFMRGDRVLVLKSRPKGNMWYIFRDTIDSVTFGETTYYTLKDNFSDVKFSEDKIFREDDIEGILNILSELLIVKDEEDTDVDGTDENGEDSKDDNSGESSESSESTDNVTDINTGDTSEEKSE